MWKTTDEMKCENVKWKMWWYEEDFEGIVKLHKNSMNSCQLIPTHYMTNIELKRIEQMNGSRMKDMEWIMNDKQARSKFRGVRGQSSREKLGQGG